MRLGVIHVIINRKEGWESKKKITITTDGEQSLKEEIMTRLMEIKSGALCLFSFSPAQGRVNQFNWFPAGPKARRGRAGRGGGGGRGLGVGKEADRNQIVCNAINFLPIHVYRENRSGQNSAQNQLLKIYEFRLCATTL